MSIWEYKELNRDVTLNQALLSKCPFCHTRLYAHATKDFGKPFPEDLRRRVWTCPVCGWWKMLEKYRHPEPDDIIHFYNAATGVLKNLDLHDASLPINEIRTYLAAKYESRFIINPRLFEETVASVFHDLGYHTLTTAYSGDGGIDVILYDNKGSLIGIQVKRYKDKIEAEQIRSLVGAMVLGGYTKGMFITTSEFQKGAINAAKLSDSKGIAIELLNGEDFFSALKIAQKNTYALDDEAINVFYEMESQHIGTWNHSGEWKSSVNVNPLAEALHLW